MARLCALIPPPRFHMVRFHGVLAPHATLRPKVVPKPKPSERPTQLSLFEEAEPLPVGAALDREVDSGRRPWAWLLRHVFKVDVSVCPRCDAKMKLKEVATTSDDIDRVLHRLGLALLARPPPRPAPPRGQLRLPLR